MPNLLPPGSEHCAPPRESPSFGTSLVEPEICEWSLWAPLAKTVEILLFPESPRQLAESMEPTGEGFYRYRREGIAEGTRYAFRLNGKVIRPDPASRSQPEGVHKSSAVFDPASFRWNDLEWRGIRQEDLVFYEIHVGTFTREGTFDAIIPRLDVLRELGITAIQLMPVAQFAGNRNWGYDGVYPFAVQSSYGGGHSLQRLVDACHRKRIALFLDLVYNHLGPEGNYLGEFAPFFTDRYATPWGQAFNFDGLGSGGVRAFVLENVRYWIRDYHIDGFRLDAIHAIHDSGPRHILGEVKDVSQRAAETRGCQVHVVAESNLNDAKILQSQNEGGFAIDAQWNDDFHHCVHTLLTGESDGYYIDYGSAQQLARVFERSFALEGGFSRFRGRRHGAPAGDLPASRFVVAIQTHDQVGNRGRGERLTELVGPAQLRLAGSTLILSPFLPLIFMGEEYAELNRFPYFCDFGDANLVQSVRRGRVDEFATFHWASEIPDPQNSATFEGARLAWDWIENPARAAHRRMYRDLLALRSRHPAARDFIHREATTFAALGAPMVVHLIRGRSESGAPGLEILLNFADAPFQLHGLGTERRRLLFSSEHADYGGVRTAELAKKVLLPFEAMVFVVVPDTTSEG